MSYNIAIDGPAGAGKSTIAKRVSAELSFIYVDTGAMYRAIALYLLKNAIQPEDPDSVKHALGEIEIAIRYVGGEQHVLLNGEDVSGQIRTEEVGNMASKSSALPCVREKLLELQQKLARENDVVMDGRDYRNQHPARCTTEDLSDGQCGYQGKSQVQRIVGKRNGL